MKYRKYSRNVSRI